MTSPELWNWPLGHPSSWFDLRLDKTSNTSDLPVATLVGSLCVLSSNQSLRFSQSHCSFGHFSGPNCIFVERSTLPASGFPQTPSEAETVIYQQLFSDHSCHFPSTIWNKNWDVSTTMWDNCLDSTSASTCMATSKKDGSLMNCLRVMFRVARISYIMFIFVLETYTLPTADFQKWCKHQVAPSYLISAVVISESRTLKTCLEISAAWPIKLQDCT